MYPASQHPEWEDLHFSVVLVYHSVSAVWPCPPLQYWHSSVSSCSWDGTEKALQVQNSRGCCNSSSKDTGQFHTHVITEICSCLYYGCLQVLMYMWRFKPPIKLSLYTPGQALRAPGGWGCQDFWKFGTWRWQGCQPYAPAASTPQKTSLVVKSVRGRVNHRAIVWPEGLSQWGTLWPHRESYLWHSSL